MSVRSVVCKSLLGLEKQLDMSGGRDRKEMEKGLLHDKHLENLLEAAVLR